MLELIIRTHVRFVNTHLRDAWCTMNEDCYHHDFHSYPPIYSPQEGSNPTELNRDRNRFSVNIGSNAARIGPTSAL